MLLRRHNFEGELCSISYPFCCLRFSSTFWDVMAWKEIEQFKEQVIILFLSFEQEASFGERKLLFLLSIRFFSFCLGFSLSTIGSVYFGHFCSQYHTLVSCTSLNSVHLWNSLQTLLWPPFVISSAVFSFPLSLPSQIDFDSWIYVDNHRTDI